MHKILFDNSGSMSELGKEALLINTLRFSRQYTEFNNVQETVEYYQASHRIDEIKIENNKDILISEPKGKCSDELLSNWLLSQGEASILWITDGYVNFSEADIFKLSSCPNISIVALGCDADIDQLKRLKTGLYTVENIETALAQFFTPQVAHFILPKKVADITVADSSWEDQSDDDEW